MNCEASQPEKLIKRPLFKESKWRYRPVAACRAVESEHWRLSPNATSGYSVPHQTA
jgi:hypothetical protein